MEHLKPGEITRNPRAKSVKCPLCAYQWQTRANTANLACPRCRKTFPNPYSQNPGKFVRCPHCNHNWSTVLRGKVYKCPKCHETFQEGSRDKKVEKDQATRNYFPAKCTKCGHEWTYHGDKTIGEVITCPFCNQSTKLIDLVTKVEVVPDSKPHGTVKTIFEPFPMKFDPEFKALIDKYHLTSEVALKTALRFFWMWVDDFETHHYTREELHEFIKESTDADLAAIAAIAQKRLDKLAKLSKNKFIFEFMHGDKKS